MSVRFLREGFGFGLASFFLILAAGSSAGQISRDTTVQAIQRAEMAQRQQQEAELRRLNNIGDQRKAGIILGKDLPLNIKPTQKDLEAVVINKDDKTKYADFLKQPRTGIIRLHDYLNCNAKDRIYNIEEPCPTHIIGRGSSFSFRANDYSHQLFGDLTLENSTLQTRGLLTLAFLTNLGNVSPETLSLSSDGIRSMAEFVPSSDKKEVEIHRKFTAKGFRIENFIYRSSYPLQENSTYALRSIAYRGKINSNYNSSSVRSIEMKEKRMDVIVVFRVIRNHGDGSISILWKELSRKAALRLPDGDN